MEESISSVQIQSRKRKESCPSSLSSKAIVGILTRSKYRRQFHYNRSGLSRSDPVSRKPIPFQPKAEPAEAFLDMNCITASRVSSIKDLRMRRVFTPDVISVQEREEDEENEERKKMSKGLDAGSDTSQVLDSVVGNAKVDEPENAEIMTTEIKEERDCVEYGLYLNDQEVLGNESLSKTKTALNKCGRKKVFKNSSSFSFRRLLPYLMDIVNDDHPCVSKIEIVDAGNPSHSQKLDGEKNSKVRSTSENIYTSKAEHVRSGIDDTNSSQNENIREFHIEVAVNQPDLNSAENELGQVPANIRPEEMERILHENVAERIRTSVEEECCQMTPPDPDMFTRREVGLDGKSVEPNNVLVVNQISNELLVGKDKSNGDALRQSPTSKSGTNLMNRPVLNPCSRPRLFKNPGSVSYRRLLPFLMDMSKNDSGASRIAEHPVPQVDVTEYLHSVLAGPSKKDNTEKIITENFHEKKHPEDRTQNLFSSMIPPPTSDGSSHVSENSWQSMPHSSSTKYSSNVESDSVISEIPPDPHMLIVQSDEMTTSQSTERNLEPYSDCKENSSASPPSSSNNVISTKLSTSKEHGLGGKPKTCLNMKLELHNNSGQSTEKVKLKQSSAEIEVSEDLLSPTNGSSKGILKRNRRGCRGLCNCLNCASFRLHAGRAFEFSRNQMHDAEEVALDMMKELANLRLFLKKSIDTDNDPTPIQLNPVLLEEACNKALETEKVAKERLSQLKDDLNVHCRIPTLLQPKVTFANYIEERYIPVLDPSTSPEKKG